ncbi:MAG: cobyric acid synthase [Pseudomonadota bacterium]
MAFASTTPAIMLQGTGSDVGKSMLVAGICRALVQRGLTVRPFKPQNMSNNAAVTPGGGEIGRAQALQARACGVLPDVHMNPVLLKPEGDNGSQVVVQGKRIGRFRAREYWGKKPELLAAVVDSFRQLSAEADVVVIEGAGSAAEINLRAGDIANMGFAEAVGVPVVLVADIDRGGVIANLVGTHAVLPEADRRLVAGYVINKFRGDPSLFNSGIEAITTQTGWRSYGVVPWFADAHRLPAEDSVGLAERGGKSASPGAIRIAVPMFPRISNHDDLDPLAMEPGVALEMIPPNVPLPGDVDLVILPGSKSTVSDLEHFRASGWAVDLKAHIRRGGHVLGLCGGYQMLGTTISDPDGIEGAVGVTPGLGLLDLETVLTPEKTLTEVTAVHCETGTTVSGYEMHIGQSDGGDRMRPFLDVDGRGEGAIRRDGRVYGTYLHGIFANDAFRSAFLSALGARATSGLAYDAVVEDTLDALADHMEAVVGIDDLLELARRFRVPKP